MILLVRFPRWVMTRQMGWVGKEVEGEIASGPAMWETNNKIILASDDYIISKDF